MLMAHHGGDGVFLCMHVFTFDGAMSTQSQSEKVEKTERERRKEQASCE